MYTFTLNPKINKSYYSLTLISSDDSHYLDVQISEEEPGSIRVSISKSEDGFLFKNPCDESSELNINSYNNLEETYNLVKTHFINKGYRFSTF